MIEPEDDSVIIEVEIMSAFPKLSPGNFLEDKRGEICLRWPDTVEFVGGKYRVTRQWIRPLLEQFDRLFYPYVQGS